MRHYDERQQAAKYQVGLETFLLGFTVCGVIAFSMMWISFEDMTELYNAMFLVLLGYYIMRCVQKNAIYQIAYQAAGTRQYVLGGIFFLLGLLVMVLALARDEISFQHMQISSGVIMLIISVITIMEGILIFKNARDLKKEAENDA